MRRLKDSIRASIKQNDDLSVPGSPGESSSVSSPTSETGWDSNRSNPALSQKEREIAKSWQRPKGFDVDEDEQRPLAGLQKVVQAGKPLTADNSYVCPPGLEGLCCAINPQNDTIAVGCRSSKILLLDLNNLRVQTTHDLSQKKVAAITAIRYRPDNHGGLSNVAYLAQESSLVTVHVTQGKVVQNRQEEGNSINALSVRPSGTPMVASAGTDKIVRVYDESTGQQTATLDHGDDYNTTGHSNIIHAVNWKPNDPNVLVSGGWDRIVNIWDLRVARAVRSISGPCICGGDNLDMRANELLTGSWRHNNPLQLWDMGTGKLLTNCPFYQPELEACMLYAAKFTSGPTDLIIAGGSGKKPCVKAFQVNGQVLGTMSVPIGVNAMANSTTYSDKLRSVVLCCTDRIMLLKI